MLSAVSSRYVFLTYVIGFCALSLCGLGGSDMRNNYNNSKENLNTYGWERKNFSTWTAHAQLVLLLLLFYYNWILMMVIKQYIFPVLSYSYLIERKDLVLENMLVPTNFIVHFNLKLSY